ncbi:hypothetical protein E2P81_ATG07661 [Venturia nashicola]|uniref:Uncharacterized protein n=1 Tax=Venturia nashicola TaxID=86259 RepID=A0A4Z1NR02_9PEZI|nr:hypothetical protein E6O75_ATG07825 [Venturia nashicola]TLD22468.1 hypothetical protein E2P81_ATG07661 [Venturia nashicola]
MVGERKRIFLRRIDVCSDVASSVLVQTGNLEQKGDDMPIFIAVVVSMLYKRLHMFKMPVVRNSMQCQTESNHMRSMV